MRLSRHAVVVPAVLALVAGAVGVPAAARAAEAPQTGGGATNASLSDSSATQQRWLSVPGSRVVLNPYTSGASTELKGSSGTDLPLSTGFYAWDNAVSTADVLTTYLRPAEGEGSTADPGSDKVLWNQVFDSSASVWNTLSGATATVGQDGMTVRVLDGKNWSAAYSDPITINPATNPKLEIVVPSVTGKWAIKLNTADGNGDDAQTAVVADTSSTGESVQTFDLAAAMQANKISASTPFRIKLWASNGGSGPAPSVTVKSMSIRTDSGTAVAWSDDFETTAGWTPQNSDISLTAADGAATLALSSKAGENYRYVQSKAITADLGATPYLSVHVDSMTGGQWALKVNDGSGDKEVRHDTTDTGELVFDLQKITGWTGTKTFSIKVFQIGKGTSTTFGRMSVHASSSAAVLSQADSVDYSWTPASLSMTGHYSSGTISTEEYFDSTDVDAFVRSIDPEGLPEGSVPVVGGAFEGSGTTYDSTSNTITIVGEHATRTIALPEGSVPTFYSSQAAAERDMGASATPTTTSGFWTADLSADAESVVGVGWAINAKSGNALSPSDADGPSNSRAGALGAASRAAGSLGHWQSFWDGYVSSVPAVEDYSIQRVADGGVTADQMESFYYKAWVNLEMNVLPATPETGNQYLQLGTGKPSLWMHGTPGTRNVASWDSLLGMQQLVYTDPDASWDSFIGMMESVSMTGAEPTDTNGVGTDSSPVIGALKGESLPSRKAQTAWILYSVTGDKDKLASIYDNLRANLIWASHNMRWIYGSNNYTDERDAEFVASLIYDLKFGSRIAELLGHEDDDTTFTTMITDLTKDYEDWFFPTTQNSEGTVFPTVQKVFLDTSRTSSPWSDPTEGPDYRDQEGRWVKAGWSFYTTTALIADQLDDEYRQKVMERFMRDYDDTEQLAGLGHFAVKAPDMQLTTYGLLDGEAIGGAATGASTSTDSYSVAQLRDMATVIVNSFNRDMVKSGWFAEVYNSTGDHKAGGTPNASGVRPSLFGISNYIDNIWIANGYRVDEGTPTVVRLDGATGGVTGLKYLGRSLDVDIDGTSVKLSGDAVGEGGLTDSVDIPVAGSSVVVPAWSEDNGGTDNGGSDNGGSDNGGSDNGGSDNGGSDNGGSTNGGDSSATQGSSASGSDQPESTGLAHTGLSTAVLVALGLLAAGGTGLTLASRRRRG